MKSKSNNVIGLLIFISLVLTAISGCERDDICSEDSPTTPLMIVKFIDIGNGIDKKSVNELKISAEGATGDLIFMEAVDSILVPLRTDGGNTAFTFTINSDTSDDDMLEPNEDRISFQYTTEEEYLNSACGFRVSYIGLTNTLTNETDNGNWIKSIVIETEDIIDESQTHVLIFH